VELLIMSEPLLNRELQIDVSEPWELSDVPGGSGRRTIVRAEDDDAERGGLLLKLKVPIEHRGAQYGTFVAVPRRGSDAFNALGRNRSVEANLYGIVGDTIPEDPFALAWWRGGLGMVATLSLLARDMR
jgi:hypothetical protein